MKNPGRPPRHDRAKNQIIDQAFLGRRAAHSAYYGYKKQKWIEFCEVMLAEGYQVSLYEARETVSKYVTVTDPILGVGFKVRFSNHKPIKQREVERDCDFFVGRTNFGVSTTDQAITATLDFLRSSPHENRD